MCQPKSQLHPQGVDPLNFSMFDEFTGVGVSEKWEATDLSGEYHVICFYI